MSKVKQAVSSVLNSIEDNRQFTGYYKKLSIPAIPKGTEKKTYSPKVGDKVITTSFSNIKEGTVLTIKEVYKQHGYVYFVTDKGGTQRLKDVKTF